MMHFIFKQRHTRKRKPSTSDITPEKNDKTTTRVIFDNNGFIMNPDTLKEPSNSCRKKQKTLCMGADYLKTLCMGTGYLKSLRTVL